MGCVSLLVFPSLYFQVQPGSLLAVTPAFLYICDHFCTHHVHRLPLRSTLRVHGTWYMLPGARYAGGSLSRRIVVAADAAMCMYSSSGNSSCCSSMLFVYCIPVYLPAYLVHNSRLSRRRKNEKLLSLLSAVAISTYCYRVRSIMFPRIY